QSAIVRSTITRSWGPEASRDARSSGLLANAIERSTRRAVSRIRATKKRSLTTATTLIVLLRVAEPVLVPFRQMGERREVPHAVQIHHAVQMIGLVLDDAREEFLGDEVDLAPVPIVALEPDGGVARHHAPHVGHRQTALPPFFHLLGERRDDGIDQH